MTWTSTGKAVFEHVEPAETALDFDPDEGFGRAVFSEEEGVTGVTIEGCEEHDQEPEQIPSKAENPPITPTPLSPKLTEQDVRDWLDRNVSELPQEFEISNLINWTWEVWQYPAHPYGWKYGKDTAVRTCSKDTASRRKFREDVVQHLMAKGLPVTGADGQIERDPVRCDRCKKLTGTYSVGLLFKDPFHRVDDGQRLLRVHRSGGASMSRTRYSVCLWSMVLSTGEVEMTKKANQGEPCRH